MSRLPALLFLAASAAAAQPAPAPADAGTSPEPAAAPPPAPAAAKPALKAPLLTLGYQEIGWWWDLNVEGGGGVWVEPGRHLFGMGRVRGGALYMAEPWYLSGGAVYEYSSLSAAAFGLQLEALHLWTGYWVQLGGLVNVQGQAGAQAAVGYSVVGVESELWSQSNAPARLNFFVKLRIPISWIFQIGKPPRIPRVQAGGG